jgi:ketosteroid isomerase-like protein
MSQDGIQTIQAFNEAFRRRDAQSFGELLDPEIEWASAENFIYADHSPYVGVDSVLKLIFGRLFADWDDFSITVGEILGEGDLVIANGRFKGRFKANGAPIDAQFVQVFQLKHGKIAKCQVYTDTAQFKETIRQAFPAGV